MNDTRSADLDEHGSIDAPPGSRPWAIAVRRKVYSAIHDRDFSSKTLQSYLDLMRIHKGYLQLTDRMGRPFATFEAFCAAPYPFGLGYKAEDIDRIIGERRDKEVRDRAENPMMLLDNPGPPTKEERKTNSSAARNKPLGKRCDADYLTARIARDRPDILERMKAGEFRSVRQAALEAGIIKPTIAIPLDPAAAARRLAKHFRGEALTALIRDVWREVYQAADIAPGQDITRINDLIVLNRIKAAAERLAEGDHPRCPMTSNIAAAP